ncbi:hypothetical protein ACO0QE_002476 [Hanseniaspora vineae]
MSTSQQKFRAPLKFNQNGTYVAVTEQDNLSIFNINPFGKIFELQGTSSGLYKSIDLNNASGLLTREELGGVLIGRYLIEMLFATSLIAVVDTIQQPKKLKIINTKRKVAICELKFDHNVRQICLNRKRLVVLLQSKQIFIYDISCMQLLHTIDIMEDKVIKELVLKEQQKYWLLKNMPGRGTTSEMDGNQPNEDDAYSYEVKMKLSGDDKSVLVYTTYSLSTVDPSEEESETTGSQENIRKNGRSKAGSPGGNNLKITLNNIMVFDALNLTQINFLPRVHNRNVQCLTLSHDGSIVVTASTRGTIIRCFKTSQEQSCFKEFRRGNRPCIITQLEVDHDIKFLACVGNSDTIHIFQMNKENAESLTGENTSSHPVPPPSSSSSVASSSTIRHQSKFTRVSKFISSNIVSHLPRQNLERNYAYIKKQNERERVILGFSTSSQEKMYVCYGDRLDVYKLPLQTGACLLAQTHVF